MKYVASFEIELTQDEVERLSQLSKEWGKDFSETARECMNTYCEQTLDMFKNNVPEDEKEN